jgi:NMT1/THI5 like protein
MQAKQSRRRFMATLSSAGAMGLIGGGSSFAEDAPPETTTIRLIQNAGICVAPQYVADELLRSEGFSEIQYVMRTPAAMAEAIGRGQVDFSLHFAALLIPAIDAGEAITLLAGVHVGCFELFANEQTRSIRDLKGKKVGIQGAGVHQHAFIAAMAAHVGLDPANDIDWVLSPTPPPMELFAEGKIDAFLGFPPEPQELRARKVAGHVVVNSSTDRPWSQYFCCMAGGQPGLRSQISHRHQACDACDSQGNRFLRERSGSCRATNGRPRFHHALRLCAADAERSPLQQVASIRSHRYDSVLFATAARSRHGQIDAQQGHCRGDRLALPQRAQARAEGLMVEADQWRRGARC